MLSRLYNRYTKPPIKLYWWRYDYPHKLNFGDEITPLLLEKLWGYKSVWSPPDSCDLAGAGSILEILQKKSGNNHVHIWGSGFIQDGEINQNENFEFHAVRGDLTKSRVQTNVALGDPGLLMPLIVPPVLKKYTYGIIPHYVDKDNPQVSRFVNKVSSSIVIDVLAPPTIVAQQISSCDIVISSSLHGVVLADAYGVENIYMKLSDKVTGNGYKFTDYGSSVNRTLKPISNLSVDLSELKARASTADRSTISSLQSGLINAFPF